MALNQTNYQGRLVKPPEMKTTQDGVCYLDFTLAWNKKIRKNDGTEKENKCFLPCKAWRSTAETIAKYMTKGDEFIVTGEMNTEEWTDKNGEKRSKLVLYVGDVHFESRRSADGQQTQAQTAKTDKDAGYVPVEGEELPF